MTREIIDFHCGLETTLELATMSLNQLFERTDCEFIETKTKGYEFYPLHNMVREELKIVIHKVNSKLTRVDVTNKSNLEFSIVTTNKIIENFRTITCRL